MGVVVIRASRPIGWTYPNNLQPREAQTNKQFQSAIATTTPNLLAAQAGSSTTVPLPSNDFKFINQVPLSVSEVPHLQELKT
jgi:hypothetical protein